jgi:alkylhydroperoxidase family enzyme
VSRGASEEVVDKVRNYETSDLPERTKVALRLADELTRERPHVGEGFYAELRTHFSDDEILDLGMCMAFALGWQRFIEAFGILPDQWREGSSLPWES